MESFTLDSEFENIINAIHDDILISDGEGRVIMVSHTFEHLYGISKESAVGMTVYELEHKGYFKPSVVSMVLKCGKSVTMNQKNNKGRVIVITATPVFDGEGKIQYVVSFSRDVTDMINLQKQYSQLEDRLVRYEEELEQLRSINVEIDGIVAKSASMRNILALINRIAPFDANVLLEGKSGVGKSMTAKLIHKKSGRAEGPFIEINCGAIPRNLLESELFGYEKGSFTGANKEGKKGLIEFAHEGTLFLDEISELPIDLQVKVLNVIQDKCITRVGGAKKINVDFRLIAASNKDLKKIIEENLFREDLYYRLDVIPIVIPPLNQRTDDIIPMIVFFTDKFNKKYGMNKAFSKNAFDAMEKYEWPGNIRELENLIERVILTTDQNIIDINDLPDHIAGVMDLSIGNVPKSLIETLEELEGKLVKNAYRKCGTTIGVAEILDISQPTAVRKIQKYVKR